MKAEEIIKQLKLQPHPAEGGYFIETYRSEENIDKKLLPERYNGNRAFSTCIYFLLTKDTFSEMHKLTSDEIFHFYFGDPVEMLNLYPDGNGEIIKIGSNINENMSPQIIVRKNVWQGSRVIKGGEFALLGTTVAPGFDFSDYQSGNREELINEYPEYKNIISDLTK